MEPSTCLDPSYVHIQVSTQAPRPTECVSFVRKLVMESVDTNTLRPHVMFQGRQTLHRLHGTTVPFTF